MLYPQSPIISYRQVGLSIPRYDFSPLNHYWMIYPQWFAHHVLAAVVGYVGCKSLTKSVVPSVHE